MLIIGNWKAYVDTPKKALQLHAAAKKAATAYKTNTIVVAPPALYIGVLGGLPKSKVLLGAQDMSLASPGAHTGEVPGELLMASGVSYILVGHSERRALGESDEIVAEKIKKAIALKATPVLCIGEKERDSEAHYLKFIRAQVASVMEQLAPKDRSKVVIAYEPIWAIGKDAASAVTPDDLTEMVLYIRKALGDFMPAKTASSVMILYGGSVEPINASSLSTETGVQGFLIGRASTDPKSFVSTIKSVS